MSKTEIEWTLTRGPDGKVYPGFTFNPWWGCEKISPGCKFCYADAFDHRLGGEHWGPNAVYKQQTDKYWKEPLAWNRKAEQLGVRLKVFCASMADVMDKRGYADRRQQLWRLIRATPWLDWLLLTKRPENFELFLPWVPCPRDSDVCKYAGLSGVMCPEATEDSDCCDIEDGVGRSELGLDLQRNPREPWPNVWLGVTAENQEYAERRIPILLATPAAVRFVSYEPALERVDLTRVGSWRGESLSALEENVGHVNRPRLDWVICGAESGAGARPFDEDWARSMKDDCKANRVPFFYKQKVVGGLKISRPLLDGKTYEEQPR